MTIFEVIAETLGNIFGSNNHSVILTIGESSKANTVVNKVRSFEIREDYTRITALTNHKGEDILSDSGMDGTDLFRGEFFTNGNNGYQDVTVGAAGSIKVNHS